MAVNELRLGAPQLGAQQKRRPSGRLPFLSFGAPGMIQACDPLIRSQYPWDILHNEEFRTEEEAKMFAQQYVKEQKEAARATSA